MGDGLARDVCNDIIPRPLLEAQDDNECGKRKVLAGKIPPEYNEKADIGFFD